MNTIIAYASPVLVPLGTVGLMMLRAKFFPRARPSRHRTTRPAPEPVIVYPVAKIGAHP